MEQQPTQQNNVLDFLRKHLQEIDHAMEHVQRSVIENTQKIRTEVAVLDRVLKSMEQSGKQTPSDTDDPNPPRKVHDILDVPSNVPTPSETSQLHPALREVGFVKGVPSKPNPQMTASDQYQEIIRNNGAAMPVSEGTRELVPHGSPRTTEPNPSIPPQNVSGGLSQEHLQDLAERAKQAVSNLRNYAEQVPINTEYPQPTQMTQPTVNKTAELTRLFTGNIGVFARGFSPNVIALGKGFVEPGYGDIKQFNEDVFKIPVKVAEGWPTGFYFEEATKRQQFFLNAGKILIWTIGINTNHPETITFAAFMDEQGSFGSKHNITELNAIELKRIYTELIRFFKLPA